jgi:2-keto-3-deoxy-L-rhamnonate aldolase RhmA
MHARRCANNALGEIAVKISAATRLHDALHAQVVSRSGFDFSMLDMARNEHGRIAIVEFVDSVTAAPESCPKGFFFLSWDCVEEDCAAAS